MSLMMLIQHGEKMTKLCAAGLRPSREAAKYLSPGRGEAV
jgi:hypothetical protein